MQIPSSNWAGNNKRNVNYTPIWVCACVVRVRTRVYTWFPRLFLHPPPLGRDYPRAAAVLRIIRVATRTTNHAPNPNTSGITMGGLYIRIGKYASTFIRVSTNRQYICIWSWSSFVILVLPSCCIGIVSVISLKKPGTIDRRKWLHVRSASLSAAQARNVWR